MSTKISDVSLRDLIKSINETERKLKTAEEQLVLLKNAAQEARIRFRRAQCEQAADYCNLAFKPRIFDGVAGMYHHYAQVRLHLPKTNILDAFSLFVAAIEQACHRTV